MRNKSKLRNSQVSWEEFDRKMRKVRLIASGVIVFLLVCAAGILFVLNQETKTKAEIKKPTIALVDEDQSAIFNGMNYNFGDSFVNLVSNDEKYNWQVVSRSVADRAYADGSIQAVIYLPQNFTTNLLTLQAVDPQKAEIDYKVQNSKSELTTNLLQDKIVNVLYDFNTSIVKMYYASVAGNVASAQTNMSNVVKSQGTILTSLKDNVYGPFQTTDQSYSMVISMAESLQLQNEGWIQSQNSFTESVTGMLESASSSFNSQLPNLTDYFETQKEITAINLLNANQGIKNQADWDQKYYYTQYESAYFKAVDDMRLFKDEQTGEESGLYSDLIKQIKDYNDTVVEVHKNIRDQQEQLSEGRDALLGLEGKLYLDFFAQEVDTTGGDTDFTYLATEDNAREAMAQMLVKSFGTTDNISQSGHLATISEILTSISVDSSEYDSLLSHLEENNSLSSERANEIRDKLSILSSYADFANISTGSVNFSDFPEGNVSQTFTKKLTITVPADTLYSLSFLVEDVAVSCVLDESSPGIDASDPSNIKLDNRSNSEIIIDEDGNEVPGEEAIPQTYTISYLIDLGQASSGKVNFQWGDGLDKHSSIEIFELAPSNSISEYIGGENFDNINILLSKIDTATSLISFLYGAPGANYKSMMRVTDFSQSASTNSMYVMYGNMGTDEIKSRLSDEDVLKFKEQGEKTITKVTETIDSLNTAIEILDHNAGELEDAGMPNDYMEKISTDLDKWYSDTMSNLNDGYKAWKVNSTGLLEEKLWSEYREEDQDLYYDNGGNEALYARISEMVTSTAAQAGDTASSAQIIESNEEQFNQMVETVTRTQNEAKAVLDNTNNLLNTGDGQYKNSQDYYGNFSSTLSNTRTEGVDANNIFDFLAKPLSAKDISPQFRAITKDFDWRWIVIFVIGILLGVLGKTWIRSKPKVKEE